MVGKNSIVWEHFNRLTEYLVSCKHCGKSLSSKHTSSNLVRHLYRQHKTIANHFEIDDDMPRDRKQYNRSSDPLGKMMKTRMIGTDDIDDDCDIKDDADFCETEHLEPMYEVQMDEELMGSTKVESPQYQILNGSPESQQLIEKLKAETRYYNEMALLAQARRRLIEVQTSRLERNKH